MVFDVTRWLPQHPGGSIIIPEQAVNIETVVLFEMYHSSRMWFQFLREFYIGDLLPEDLEKVPPACGLGEGTPSHTHTRTPHTHAYALVWMKEQTKRIQKTIFRKRLMCCLLYPVSTYESSSTATRTPNPPCPAPLAPYPWYHILSETCEGQQEMEASRGNRTGETGKGNKAGSM